MYTILTHTVFNITSYVFNVACLGLKVWPTLYSRWTPKDRFSLFGKNDLMFHSTMCFKHQFEQLIMNGISCDQIVFKQLSFCTIITQKPQELQRSFYH